MWAKDVHGRVVTYLFVLCEGHELDPRRKERRKERRIDCLLLSYGYMVISIIILSRKGIKKS